MIYLLDSTKVPFIISHAHHAHVLLFLLYTVLSQSVLLGLRFTHNSVFSLPPTLCSDWNLCLALSFLPYAHYIFRTTRMCTIQQLLLDSSTSLCIYIRLIILKVTIKFQDFSGFPGPVRSLHLCYGIILD